MPHRLQPSEFTSKTLGDLSTVLARQGQVAIIDEEGNRVEIPRPLFEHLIRLIRFMEEKRTVVLIPEDETMTTQAAANYLGMSRQYLVNLLEGGEIPFDKVGTHRRVQLRHLIDFERQRERKRRAVLDQLSKAIDEAGLYNASYTGDE